MFAPHCPTCATRVLLGASRIVHLGTGLDGRHVVVLRCRCDTLVTWDSRPPARQAVPQGSSTPEVPVQAEALLAGASAGA